MEECSKQKDALFEAKARKMHEIGEQVRILDLKIQDKRDYIENQVEVQLKEAMATLAQTEAKIADVHKAHQMFL